MKHTNFYQPKKNAYNDRRRAWFKYSGSGLYGLVDGEMYSYKCLRSASGLHLECLRTRIRDENLGCDTSLVTDFTLRASQSAPFAQAKEKQANRRDIERAEKINRCIGGNEELSQLWLKKSIISPEYLLNMEVVA
jgi:hypothetical protein